MGSGGAASSSKPRHHVLDLLLLGAAVADHRRLDRQRRVFGDFQSGGGGRQHGDAADLAQFERGLHVEGIENIFDGDFIGLVLDNDFAELGEDAGQAAAAGLRAERA